MAAVLFTLFDFDSFEFVLLAPVLSALNKGSFVNLNFAPSKFENKV